MKIRSGFVSNSSSSSFIVIWQLNDKDIPNDESLEIAFQQLFQYYGCSKIDGFTPIEFTKYIDEIRKNTTQLNNNVFESKWWASMRNDIFDYGIAPMILLFALQLENCCSIIKFEERSDY